MNNTDLCFTSAVDLGRLFQARELSPAEVVEKVLARIGVCNPILNAFLTGQLAASVPCGFTSEGLPVRLQIVGRWRDEATVLRAAACFEAAQQWAPLQPPQPE